MSYRRRDPLNATGRPADTLVTRFGSQEFFRAHRSGSGFPRRARRSVRSAQVILPVFLSAHRSPPPRALLAAGSAACHQTARSYGPAPAAADRAGRREKASTSSSWTPAGTTQRWGTTSSIPCALGHQRCSPTTTRRAPSRHVATASGSVLDRVYQVSRRVAAFANWAPAHATMYVLTGIVPRAETITVEVQRRMPLAVRSRIVMTIDPTCTPQEVAAAYRQARKPAFGRLKRLSKKHATLGVFAVTHGHLPVPEQRHAWNEALPTQRYRHLWQFRRDCRQAVARLLELNVHAGP